MPSGHPLQEYYSRIYKTYDLVNRLFTFGMDARWRRHTVEACLQSRPVSILDLCCGTGELAISMGRAAGKAVHITGFDLNLSMLELARQKACRPKADHVDFIQGDAGSMPFRDGEFDCITIGFGFRNLTFENPNRDLHCREISRIMKPGARLIILESSVPGNRVVSFFYRAYLNFLLVPLGGLLSGDWNAYRYLSGSSAGFYSFEELSDMLRNYGLTLKSQRKYLFGSVNLLVATRI